MRIAVAIPTHDVVPAAFMYDLASMVAFTVASLPDDVEFGIQMVQGTYIHNARLDLMKLELDERADYVLWLDSDMRFPRDAFVRLLKHKKDIVGINYAKRGIPSGFVAIKAIGIEGETPERLRTTDTSAGLEEVAAIGFGCVLIRTQALIGMPAMEAEPWFQNKYLGHGRWMGEDVYFCVLAGQNGLKIWVDHDLSKECKHVGQFEYELAHAELTESKGEPETEVVCP